MNYRHLSKYIMKELKYTAKHADRLTHPNFYERKIKELNLSKDEIVKFYHNCNEDLIGMMAYIRAEQLGLIDKNVIYLLILSNDKISSIELNKIILMVQKDLYYRIGGERIRILCNNNYKLFIEALNLRVTKMNNDEVEQYIYLKRNKE